VRFAPSRQELHVGNARTALFNWLFARTRGDFILRIRGYRQGQETREFETSLLDDSEWLGIDWTRAVTGGA